MADQMEEVNYRMAKCKITVLKRMFNADLAEAYRRPDVHFGPCPHYAEGDEFVVVHFGVRPEGFFCDWAWNDIQSAAGHAAGRGFQSVDERRPDVHCMLHGWSQAGCL